ncbi:UNVERIFIED_CONTAM: hypothetical protein FKN15_005447 [Acipenser sinensis]
MKTGLGMIILGHTVFILGAIIHGAVLRHVTRPEDIHSIEYAIANIIAVASGLVVRDAHTHTHARSRNNLSASLTAVEPNRNGTYRFINMYLINMQFNHLLKFSSMHFH